MKRDLERARARTRGYARERERERDTIVYKKTTRKNLSFVSNLSPSSLALAHPLPGEEKRKIEGAPPRRGSLTSMCGHFRAIMAMVGPPT